MSNIINSCKVRHLEYKISSKPLVCYKIFKIKDNTHYGPFTDYSFPLIIPGMIIEPQIIHNYKYAILKRIFPALYDKYIKSHKYKLLGGIHYNKEHNWWDITSGFIHTLPYCPENLKHYCNDWGTYELWECEIPKNTLYFQADCRGSHYEANGTYASKQLKIIRCIDTITI